MAARVTSWNYAAFGRQVLASEAMVAEMAKRAEKIKAAAEADAPVLEDGPHPGRYKAAFAVSSGVKESKKGRRRAFGRVTNDAPEARWVEYGTTHNPRHRTLGRALDAGR